MESLYGIVGKFQMKHPELQVNDWLCFNDLSDTAMLVLFLEHHYQFCSRIMSY